MTVMYDSEIRTALVDSINNRRLKPQRILHELSVHNGNAVADVVAVYKDPHCYEIKGSSDKVERAVTQGKYYETTFRKITIVTTKSKLDVATRILPDWWGIATAEERLGKIHIIPRRRAAVNPSQSKPLSLLVLWKDELLQIATTYRIESVSKRSNRETIANLIADALTKSQVNLSISEALVGRQYSTLQYK